VPSRVACLLIPLFPLAARLRSEPDLAGEAVAILAGNGQAARVVAASKPARRAGVRAGLTLREARAVLPGLIARGSDPECERSAREAALEAAETVSPRVEDAAPGEAYLDVDGLDLHFGFSEKALGRSLAAAVEGAGLAARIGIAASKLAARVAAESPGSPVVVASGGEAEFLAPNPLGDVITFELTVAKLGASSVTLRVEGKARGKPCIRASAIIVHSSLNPLKAQPFPEALRTRMERFVAA